MFDSAYIDRIVQSVMQDLASRGTGTAARCSAGIAVADAVPKSLTAVPTEPSVAISARVITADVLATAQAAGRMVTLPSGAVLTPTGRDFIRKHQVRIASGQASATNTALAGVLVTIGELSTCSSAAKAAGWKTVGTVDEPAAAALASQQLASGIVVCCGEEPSVVACLLNRNSAIRAAVITKATNLQKLSAVMSPHVVCLESSGWSFGDVLKMLRSLTTECGQPKSWREL